MIPRHFGKLQLVHCIGTLTIPCQEAPTTKNTSAKLMPGLLLHFTQAFTAFSYLTSAMCIE